MASTVPGRVAARVPAAASPKQLIQSVSVLECDHLGACARQLPHKQVCLREHTVPQTGTANRQHESYANHVGLLVNILERPQQIRLHCADFGCIMGTYIANNCRAPSPWSSVIGSYIPALMKIVVAVPKWHIVAHVDKCFSRALETAAAFLAIPVMYTYAGTTKFLKTEMGPGPVSVVRCW
jgi:hypothetical protein